MSAAPKPKTLTLAEALVIERDAPFKSEFVGGVLYPLHPDGERGMAGASRPHNRVNENLSGEMYARLKGAGCQSYSRDLRVRVDADGHYVYPDLVVVCGAEEYAGDDPDALLNPTAVVEVLSDSTEAYDRGGKFLLYQQVASLREYVLVSQRGPVVERYVRQADGTWTYSAVVGRDAEFAFAAVPARVRLADLFAGVTFPDRPSGPQLAVLPAPPPV
ncbi:MAG: Uma2 family endonuclease [Gemmataceae bacterium]|nr:Uma2 family endonuclease [Gemmataceae bacterium]